MKRDDDKVCHLKTDRDSSTVLSLSVLSIHHWEAANILRGPVDAADFKTYIFPLLFFKRISDVYDDELADAMELSGGDQQFAQFPENHRFQIPEGCHWEDDPIERRIGGRRRDPCRIGLARGPRPASSPDGALDTRYGPWGDAGAFCRDSSSYSGPVPSIGHSVPL